MDIAVIVIIICIASILLNCFLVYKIRKFEYKAWSAEFDVMAAKLECDMAWQEYNKSTEYVDKLQKENESLKAELEKQREETEEIVVGY